MASCSETLSETASIVETTQSTVVNRLLVITSVVHYRHAVNCGRMVLTCAK